MLMDNYWNKMHTHERHFHAIISNNFSLNYELKVDAERQMPFFFLLNAIYDYIFFLFSCLDRALRKSYMFLFFSVPPHLREEREEITNPERNHVNNLVILLYI